MGIKKMLLELEMGIQEQDGNGNMGREEEILKRIYGSGTGNTRTGIGQGIWDWEYGWQLDREYGTGNETRNGI